MYNSSMGRNRALQDRIAAECLGMRVRLLNRVVSGIYNEALRGHGLKVSQMTLLVAVAARGPVAAAALGRALCIEKSTLSRTLQRMEQQGWLAPEPALRLTPKGRRLLERAGPDWRRAQKEVTKRLGRTGAMALAALAERVRGGERDEN